MIDERMRLPLFKDIDHGWYQRSCAWCVSATAAENIQRRREVRVRIFYLRARWLAQFVMDTSAYSERQWDWGAQAPAKTPFLLRCSGRENHGRRGGTRGPYRNAYSAPLDVAPYPTGQRI